MKIKYATVHRWRKEVTDEPLSLFGRSEQKKMRSTLNFIGDSEVSYEIKPLDEDFFKWWQPLYVERISSKENPHIFDVKNKTLGKKEPGKKYYSFTLFEGENRLGGLIFSVKLDTLFFAYRTIAYDWQRAKLRASPSLYVEYAMAIHAKDIGLKYISHGRDRNPYGLNSGIGLAAFKLTTGCSPYLPLDNFEIRFIDTEDLEKDAFIMEYKEDGAGCEINKANLVVDEVGADKWRSLISASERLEVVVIKRGGGSGK